jgi:hypothetical protein
MPSLGAERLPVEGGGWACILLGVPAKGAVTETIQRQAREQNAAAFLPVVVRTALRAHWTCFPAVHLLNWVKVRWVHWRRWRD